MFEERNVTRMLGSYLTYKSDGRKCVGKCVYARVDRVSRLSKIVEGLSITAGIQDNVQLDVQVIGDHATIELLNRPDERVAVYGVHNPMASTMSALIHNTDEPVFRWMPKPAWSTFIGSKLYNTYINNAIRADRGGAYESELMPMVHIMYTPARQWCRSYNRNLLTLAGVRYDPEKTNFSLVENMENYFPGEHSEQEALYDDIVFRLAERETFVGDAYMFYSDRFGMLSSPTMDTLVIQCPNEKDTYDIYYRRIKIGQSVGGELRMTIPKMGPVARQVMDKLSPPKVQGNFKGRMTALEIAIQQAGVARIPVGDRGDEW